MKKGLGLGIIGVGIAAIAGGIVTLLKGGNGGLPAELAEDDDIDEFDDFEEVYVDVEEVNEE